MPSRDPTSPMLRYAALSHTVALLDWTLPYQCTTGLCGTLASRHMALPLLCIASAMHYASVLNQNATLPNVALPNHGDTAPHRCVAPPYFTNTRITVLCRYRTLPNCTFTKRSVALRDHRPK